MLFIMMTASVRYTCSLPYRIPGRYPWRHSFTRLWSPIPWPSRSTDCKHWGTISWSHTTTDTGHYHSMPPTQSEYFTITSRSTSLQTRCLL